MSTYTLIVSFITVLANQAPASTTITAPLDSYTACYTAKVKLVADIEGTKKMNDGRKIANKIITADCHKTT